MGNLRALGGRQVSMESGLEDRNNRRPHRNGNQTLERLNGVRPRRPEQCDDGGAEVLPQALVSMESGLEDRNN